MSTTDETTDAGASPGGTPSGKPPAWMKAARRYGPIAAVVALIAGAVVVFGGGGDGGDDGGGSGGDTEVASQEELIRSGPMTPQKAELEGVDVADIDFGPNCDTELGTIMLVSVYAPPCVEAFEGDNGGATSPGVTADEIKIVSYQADPALDPLTAATVEQAGADVDPESGERTVQGYADLYNQVVRDLRAHRRRRELHGHGTRATTSRPPRPTPSPSPRWSRSRSSVGPSSRARCSPQSWHRAASSAAPTARRPSPRTSSRSTSPTCGRRCRPPTRGSGPRRRAIGTYAAPGRAELAGDPAMHDQDRVYALVHYDNPNGDHQPVYEEFVRQLEAYGIELATDIEFQLDLARSQENARTNISKLEDAGVTTIIYYGDPITPGALTAEATAQDYRPEWILGPSLLMDTTIFARLTDGEQWKNGFGVSTTPVRGPRADTDAFRIWRWAYGEEVPNNTARILEPPIRTIFTGIHLAGPDLTVESFRDAMWRTPPAGGGLTQPLVSRGDHGFWPEFDWGGSDDGSLIWWDPTATGEDEVGNEGAGMYRYANGGERFTFDEGPETLAESGLFDVESSVTVYDEIPEVDQVPDYPPPSG